MERKPAISDRFMKVVSKVVSTLTPLPETEVEEPKLDRAEQSAID